MLTNRYKEIFDEAFTMSGTESNSEHVLFALLSPNKITEEICSSVVAAPGHS